MQKMIVALLLCCGLASAQGAEVREKIKKEMEDITRLMRESEQWLLEMTKVERVVQNQEQVLEKLEKLLKEPPPAAADPQQQQQQQKQREKLEQEQQQIVRKLQEMLNGQKNSAEMSVKRLQELLKNLPRQQQQQPNSSGDPKEKKNQDQQKRLNDKPKEQTQEKPESPRKKQDAPKDPEQQSRKKSQREAARNKRIQAWIARLPPEELEKINRNDFSSIPSRYRRLVEEYTRRRAKREAEKDK